MDKAIKEHMIEWLSSVLWHLEDSAVLHGEAADAIISLLEKQFEADARNEQHRFPEPLAFLQALEIREHQTQKAQ